MERKALKVNVSVKLENILCVLLNVVEIIKDSERDLSEP